MDTLELEAAAVAVGSDGPVVNASFTIQPKVLVDAIKEVTSDIRRSTDTLAFVVVRDPQSPLFQQQAISPSADSGRLIIGAMGDGANHAFVDVPLTGVLTEGVFLFPQPERLMNYAKATRDQIQIEHIQAEDSVLHLRRVSSTPNLIRLPIELYYDPASVAEQAFPALSQRFTTPTTPLDRDALGDLFRRSHKMAASFSVGDVSRHGDLAWSNSAVEFVTNTQGGQHVICAVQKREFDLDPAVQPSAALQWGIPTEHLKALAAAMANDTENVYFDFTTNQVDTLGQLSYSTKMPWGVMYVARQFQIGLRTDPLKTWANGQDDAALFGHENAKLFAAVSAAEFFEAVSRAHVQDAAAVLKLERAVTGTGDDAQAIVQMVTSGQDMHSVESVPAVLGDSSLPELLLHPDVVRMMQRIVDDAYALQLISFPMTDPAHIAATGPEWPRAMIVVPVPAGQELTVKVTEPDRYLLAFWHS